MGFWASFIHMNQITWCDSWNKLNSETTDNKYVYQFKIYCKLFKWLRQTWSRFLLILRVYVPVYNWFHRFHFLNCISDTTAILPSLYILTVLICILAVTVQWIVDATNNNSNALVACYKNRKFKWTINARKWNL